MKRSLLIATGILNLQEGRSGQVDGKPSHKTGSLVQMVDVGLVAPGGAKRLLMSQCPITQQQYRDVMQQQQAPRPFHPVVGVTWYEAVEFCNRLSTREGLEPAYLPTDEPYPRLQDEVSGYRLPTEGEWSSSVRTPEKQPWCAKSGPRAVGVGTANELDLYDMLGLVWEWCQDQWSTASGPDVRVVRGGGFDVGLWAAHADIRTFADASSRSEARGFRIVRVALSGQRAHQ